MKPKNAHLQPVTGGFFYIGFYWFFGLVFFMPTLVPGVGSAPVLLLGSKILDLKEQIRRILFQDQIKKKF